MPSSLLLIADLLDIVGYLWGTTTAAQPQEQSVRHAIRHNVAQDIKHLQEDDKRLETDNAQLKDAKCLLSRNNTLLWLNKDLRKKTCLSARETQRCRSRSTGSSYVVS
ncbi:uncharacterized protein BDZ99DRAFT_53690 [Mytilinidion resinicola]|uniref:HOOK N-terminal domain-containing protein n=1 Tax=Mytilinidion resinicola TaxID=574789 RepID=A0A6A6YHU8_9PEZI|nr:uncharacterized protein BDZ99DRAFT_53690 [Mytilinidion resinicola]KAF2808350.1 hypothetical protein BDZ99DRAFT_53690 [Mytilinidion resinicola]